MWVKTLMVLIVWKVGEVLCATETGKSSCEGEVAFRQGWL
jgi:hypothetical protein